MLISTIMGLFEITQAKGLYLISSRMRSELALLLELNECNRPRESELPIVENRDSDWKWLVVVDKTKLKELMSFLADTVNYDHFSPPNISFIQGIK